MTLPQGLMDGDKYAAKEAHIRKKKQIYGYGVHQALYQINYNGHKTLYVTCEIRGPWVKIGANMAI